MPAAPEFNAEFNAKLNAMPRGKPFEPKNRLAQGGARENAGRPSDEFRELCREAIRQCRAVEVMAAIASGEEFPQLATSQGEVLPLPPSLRDRQRAIEWLADRGHGKAEQKMEMTGGSELAAIPSSALQTLVDALKERSSDDLGSRTRKAKGR